MAQSPQFSQGTYADIFPLQYFSPTQPTRAHFWGTVTLFGALVAGTGGMFDIDNTARVPSWTKCSIIREKRAEKEEISSATDALSVADRLQRLRDILGLKMSEMADIFGVSRQSAYAWLGGTLPRAEIVKKIWTLSNCAEELRHAGIARVELFTHRPVLQNGRSLFDLFVSGESLDRAIILIRATAEKEARLRSEATLRHSEAFNESRSSSVRLVKPLLEEGSR